jgi:capsular exopolysaccharide synthesis family protein
MKDSLDRSDEPLPVRRTSLPPVAQPVVEAYDDYIEPAPPAPVKRVSLRLVSRALKRHWWQALVLWLAGSMGLAALAYYKIKPTFDAASQVRVEAAGTEVFGKQATLDFGQYLQTQVSLITSPTIIEVALQTHPELTTSPFLLDTKDPVIELRQALRVGIVPRTNLIQVEMSSPVPGEAALLVNAVVGAYLAHAQATYDASTQKQIDQLSATRLEQLNEVKKQRTLVEDVVKNLDAAHIAAARDRDRFTIESYQRWSEELTRVEIERISTKTQLDQLRASQAVPARGMSEEALRAAIVESFYEDPQVKAIEADITAAQTKLKNAQRLTRVHSDPSVTRHSERIKELTDDKNDLWQKLEPRIRRQLAAGPLDDTLAKEIKAAELKLDALTSQQTTLSERLDKIRIENRNAEGETLRLEFAKKDLLSSERVLEKIDQQLNQLKYDAKSPVARVNLEFKAKPTNRPNSNQRTTIMAATPVAVGMLLTCLLVLLELRGARVGDPDELSNRVKLQVIGVVPPLPQIRSNGSVGAGAPALNGDLRAQRQLDEFVQSLDHLRVALCARPDPWGRDRHCVLITSACGSEGKTTLAAQLAERCVNAGLMTLLIDADLRNPTLSRMLDAPENPGLINVLRGEVSADDVVMVIGDAGGFHLLPAGTPRVDPSRLLQGDRLGKLMAQARESFDMIIVDAPPVLPVPDALTIGRWTDGAVLAVRYDTSRFPLVERANSRLARVGVPVIGAVVNGVRAMESTYGGYSYGYGYGYGYGTTYGSAPVSPPAAPVVDD